jgi:hypothetical protein
MAVSKIEARLTALEAEVAKLKEQVRALSDNKKALVTVVRGTFANDPDFETAMELGRKYRAAQRPKPIKKKSVKKTQSVKRRA